MELTELRNKIIEASQKYYAGEASGVSDEEFDAMIYQLEELSPGDELLQMVASGYSPKTDTSGEKIHHKYLKVGSLNKINAETCEKYFAQRPGQYVITSKIDGGSIVVYYDGKGNLDKAITRGNGSIGIDCTSKLKHIVPLTTNLANIAVRGEITMDQNVFLEFYPDAASPRSSAMGINGKDDPTIEEIKRLSFVAYNLYGESNAIPSTKSAILNLLKLEGFNAAEYSQLTISALDSGFLESLKGRLNTQYLADGLVITNEYDPSLEIAYKFVAETAETTVTKVEWETSRLGSVIPVVHFNSVKLSGANLAKCSGFNAKWICDNRIGPFSKIAIHRAGEVIPYIKSVLKMGAYSIPTDCPVCNTPIAWKGVHIYCPNPNCSSKIQSNLLHWIETMAQVDALGENILVPFLKAVNWASIQDIYMTSDEEWKFILSKPDFTKHAAKLLWQMHYKLYMTPVDPGKFFAAFGLPAVGTTISKKIVDEIGIHEFFKDGVNTTERLSNFSRTSYIAVDSLVENFKTMERVYHQIMELQGFIKKEGSKVKIKVAITGKLSKPRKELTEEFAENGIEVIGSITKECDYLVTDDPTSGSTKNLMAKKLGIVILSEDDFRSELSIP